MAEEEMEDSTRQSEHSKGEGGRPKEWLLLTSWSANRLGAIAGISVTRTAQAGGTREPLIVASCPLEFPESGTELVLQEGARWWLPDLPIPGHFQV